MVAEGEALPEGEEGVGDIGVVLDSGWLGEMEADARVRLVGVVEVSEVVSVCEGFRAGVVSLGEEGTDAVEKMGGGELSTGEVIRGMGEDG